MSSGEYPEHEKLKAVKAGAQTVGEFLPQWAVEEGV